MKKILSLGVIFFLLGFYTLKAQNPIPSYAFPVYYHANFQEQSIVSIQADNYREKRDVVVRTSCGGTGKTTCSATVWVYSLDGQTIYGPFTVNGGETLRVEIDDRQWGVYIESDDHVNVDVWIEEGGSKSTQNIKDPFSRECQHINQ